MIYRSIFSFNLGALYCELGHLLQFGTCQPVGKLSELGFKPLSPSQLRSCREDEIGGISPLSRPRDEGKNGARESEELRKATYPSKTFSFQLRASSSSAEQSSITELLRLPNLSLSLSLSLSRSAVVPR